MKNGLTIRFTLSALAVLLTASLSGCHWDMWNNARIKPLEASVFFEDGQAARPLVEGTIPYQGARTDDHYYAGRVNGEFAKGLPASIELNRELLERGQARYNIYCVVCHGATGESGGMIVQRGFPAPPSYIDLLRREPPADQLGYYFDVMTNGFGRMYSYESRVSVEDRWAIAAYIRVLQLAQYGTPENLPPDILEMAEVESAKTAAAADSQSTQAGEADHGAAAEHTQGEH